MPRRKLVFIVSIFIILMGCLTACGGNGFSLENSEEKSQESSAAADRESANIEKSEETERLVLAVVTGSPALSRAVVEYNKLDRGYYVELKTHTEDEIYQLVSEIEDGALKLQAEILSQDAPDLIGLTYLSVENYMESGILEDLSPWLTQSARLKRSDFRESVLRGMTYQDKLAAIPAYLSVDFFSGKSKFLGESEGISMEELMAVAQAYPDMQLLYNGTRSDIFDLFTLCLDQFWDEKKKECYFDSPLFAQILALCEQYPVYKKNYVQTEEEALFAEDKVLLVKQSFIALGHLKSKEQRLGGEKQTLLGYPTPDGTPGCIIAVDDAFGMVSTSEHKEGAWDFLEYFLSGELDKLDPSAGEYESRIPVCLDKWNQILERAKRGDYDGTMNVAPMEEEEIRQLENLLDHAVIATDMDYAILQILGEELEAFFKGTKNAEETILVLQNRVNLLLQENN